MSIELEDLVGLNATKVARLIALSPTDSQVQVQRLLNGSEPLVVAGMRHTQGGHTALDGGHLLFTETMGLLGRRRIEGPEPGTNPLVDVAAGVTWSELHAHLNALGLSPMVQQSSAHFTVGGSIAVNCHGRDPRWGPMVHSLESVEVLCGDGKTRVASRSYHQDLFRAVVGGHGACGLILRAQLRLVPNVALIASHDDDELALGEYVAGVLRPLLAAGSASASQLHHGWLNATASGFWDSVWYNDYVQPPGRPTVAGEVLRSEGWGESEILRAAWVAARRNPGIRDDVWRELKQLSSRERESRTNLLRAPVGMTLSKGDAKGVDLLQEYFLPPDRVVEGVRSLKRHFQGLSPQVIHVLTGTLRVVRRDDETHLSYCRGQDRVSLAVEMHVAVETPAGGVRQPSAAVQSALWQANEIVMALGGSFYLAYHRLANPVAGKPANQQFMQAYGAGGLAHYLQAQRDAIRKYDPSRRFWNHFLQAYLA
jgi:decaprenylphospho-beta-D-ribofuranose 2-oxidase